MRQLGKPALLAATYKGDAVAIAAAAMEELESTLVDTLTQLERSSPGTPGARSFLPCLMRCSQQPADPFWPGVFDEEEGRPKLWSELMLWPNLSLLWRMPRHRSAQVCAQA